MHFLLNSSNKRFIDAPMVKRILLLAVLSFSGLVNAQIPTSPITVQSPNAASLGEYGKVPVSLYTGLPTIEVPLHAIQASNTNIPVSLSYHASGFRPDQHPGWVGMGWNLNAGGAITRIVNDLPDDYNNAGDTRHFPQGGANKGFYFFSNVLNSINWATTTYLQNVTRSDLVYYDTQPDEFSFNFLGYNGKFFKDTDANGTWKVRCDKPVKVTLNNVNPFLPVNFAVPPPDAPVYDQGYSPSFGGFTITAEDGTQYVFGNTSEAIEYSVGIFAQNTEEWTADTWYLTKIIPVSHREINFTYAHDDYISQMYISVYERLYYKTRDAGGFFSNTNSCGGTEISNSVLSFFSGKLIRPAYLVSINSTSETVWFDRSSTVELRYPLVTYDKAQASSFGNKRLPFLQNRFYNLTVSQCTDKLIWKKLEQIRVVANDGHLIRKFVLNYSDNQSNPNAANQRLTLLGITESGDGGTAKPPYVFGYYNNLQNLSNYFVNQSDHWGFYNATTAPIATRADLSAYYSNRNPNPNSSVYLAGMLTKITYPTGGVTEFTYKQHQFAKQVAEDRAQPLVSLANNSSAGGVCISKISSYSLDNPGQKNEKEYFYVTGYSSVANPSQLPSSGVLTGKIKYYFDDYRAAAFNRPGVDYAMTVFSSQPVLSAGSNGQGGHIGYSQVVEKRTDGSYSKHVFTNFDNGRTDEAAINTLQFDRTAYEPYSLREQDRGHLLQEQSFNNHDVIVRERTIQYSQLPPVAPATDYVKSLNASFINVCPYSFDAVEQATAYKIYTYPYLQTQESETVYDANGNNGFTKTSSIAYNAFNLPTSVTTTTSGGISSQTRYRYVTDLSYSGPNPYIPATQGILLSATQNILSTPVETVRYRDGFVVGGTVMLPAFTNSTFVAPYQIYEFETPQPIAANQYTNLFFPARSDNFIPPVLDQKYKLRETFNAYDANGNVLNEIKEGQISISYLWDYNKTLLVAKVDNAAPNQIAYTGFEADGPSYVGGTFQSAGPYGWDYNPQLGQLDASGNPINLQRSGGLTGKGFYILAGNWSINRASLAPGDYELTFWAQAGLGSISVWPDNASQIISNTDEGTGPLGFHLLHYRIRVTQGSIANPTGSVTIDAPGQRIAVDDVRLSPVGALMTTYTHAPGIGLTSTSDANNRPVYYEYDGLNRLWVMRDQDRNIVKHYQYHYKN